MKTMFLSSGQTLFLRIVTHISPSVGQWLLLEYTHTLKIIAGEGGDQSAKRLCIWPHSSQMGQETVKNQAAEEETVSALFWGKI